MLYTQQDSITTTEPVIEIDEAEVSKHTKPQHPYQVLRLLPKDATPAQQDSAIQATFQPKEIRYSNRPDTLHIPGHEVGKSVKDVSLPKYYKESFFSTDTLFHPELNGGRYGMAGDPVPYTLRGDNVLTILLLSCFLIGLVSFSKSWRFIVRQAKRFLYVPQSEHNTSEHETSEELRFQFFLVIQTGLLLALLQYFYTQQYIGTTFILSSQYQLIAIFFGLNLAYFVLKGVVYHLVNTVFFGIRKSGEWLKSFLFITGIEGVSLLPIVLLQVYFNLSMQNVLVYFIIILIFVKILTFYKAYLIFFRRGTAFLQIFLYFCALEVVPLAALGGVLVAIGNFLKINY